MVPDVFGAEEEYGVSGLKWGFDGTLFAEGMGVVELRFMNMETTPHSTLPKLPIGVPLPILGICCF